MRARFGALYGAGPLHLVAHLAGFAIAAFALVQILGQAGWVNFLAFFAGAALLHDLLLLPLYAGLDRVIARVSNHVRVPALISAVLLLIYLPLISGRSDASYRAAAGHNPHGYLRNWLLISAGLFLASGLVYGLRAWRHSPGHG
jgi:hypothetical protein